MPILGLNLAQYFNLVDFYTFYFPINKISGIELIHIYAFKGLQKLSSPFTYANGQNER